MLSKNKIKEIHSLERKKGRLQSGLFVAEGPKVVGDLIAAGMAVRELYATSEWLDANEQLCRTCSSGKSSCHIEQVSQDELSRASFLQHPQQVLGLFEIPTNLAYDDPHHSLVLALDGVQDPGNLGTIIRVADWFGIHTIYCSEETADVWAPKVVQATMGSLARVRLCYCNLPDLVSSFSNQVPVYGTLLDGEDIYQTDLQQHGIIVMGNEGKGLTPAIRSLVTHRLFIPNYPQDSATAESLNVAIATAIVCAEFRRRA